MADDDTSSLLENYFQDIRPVVLWLILIVAASIAFWLQAVITEERLVPSLNVIANHFKIPDDIAGATLMAAGASAPELLAMIISIFITHSSIGLGTIIGSEIFNQLVCVAGATLAARNQRLQLNRGAVAREVSFYALSLIFLLIAISDKRPSDDDIEDINHIYLSFFDGLLLLTGYILYVIVCSNFDRISAIVRITDEIAEDKAAGLFYEAFSKFETDVGRFEKYQSKKQLTTITTPILPFLHQVQHEPWDNFHFITSQEELMTRDNGSFVTGLYRSESIEKSIDGSNQSFDIMEEGPGSQEFSGCLDTLARTKNSFSKGRMCSFLVHSSAAKPSKIRGMTDIEQDKMEDKISCFLWQQSNFYNKARIDINAWQLRWFSFYCDKIVSVPNRVKFNKRKVTYPRFDKIEVDEVHLVMKLHSAPSGARNYVFLAPSPQVLATVVLQCEKMMERWANQAAPISPEIDDISPAKVEDSLPIISFPTGASFLQILLHILLFPLKLFIHVTVPDVRHTSFKGLILLAYASFAAVSCMAWLIFGSYVMVSSLEKIGYLMNIPDTIIGITISAAGTSLPVYVASQVAARQGLGNMAVSNAFGANTFNIFIGLGLPWTLRAAFESSGDKYHDLRDDGITESVIILSAVLLIFVVFMIKSNFVLHSWHAYTFFGIYILYLGYAIGQVFFLGWENEASE